jgi:hypothetical protein
MARIGQIDLFTKRIRKPPTPKEFALHTMVADDLLRWCRPTWRYTHIPSGELRDPATAAKLKRMGVVAGWPDFALLGPPGLHLLELKRKGAELTEEQDAFRYFCRSVGVPFEVADTYRGALDVLKGWNVLRVNIAA